MNKNFLEIKNVSFRAGGKTKVKNVSFNIEGHNDLDEKLIAAAEKNGLYYLKGHRAIGGMRASIYNAMPFEAIEKLVNFLDLITKKIK